MEGLPEQVVLELSPERGEEAGQAPCWPKSVQAESRTDIKLLSSEFSRKGYIVLMW